MKLKLYELRIGSHLPFRKNIYDTIICAIKNGMYCCQFFLGNPKGYKRQIITEKDINNVRDILNNFNMDVFTHFPYIANLNGLKAQLAWDGDKQVDDKLTYILSQLEYELDIVSKFKNNRNICGVVIHPGCYAETNIGLKTVAKTINKINFPKNSLLLLENCAGEGVKLCKNFKEIKTLLDNIDKNKIKNIGVCVDTAHIWGKGDYDLRHVEDIDRMFKDFDKIIGIEFFKLLHLNDSKVQLGSKKDRHELLEKGEIWKYNNKSLVYLIKKCKEYKIPIILETEYTDMNTIHKIQKLL